MKKNKSKFGWLLAIFAVAPAMDARTASAQGTPLPFASIQGQITTCTVSLGCTETLLPVGGGPVNYGAGCLFSNCQGEATLYTSFVGGTPLLVTTGNEPYTGFYESVSGNVTYAYEVAGPTTGAAIPIVFTITSAEALFTGSASGQFIAASSDSTFATIICDSSGSGCPGGSNIISGPPGMTFNFTAPANTIETMSISVGGTIPETGGGTWTTSFDPSITLGPGAPSGYSILFSPDAAPVPLPASAWLMLSGLGGLALLGRRRITPQR